MSTYTFSDTYRQTVADTLLEPINRGESAFVRWFPGHGKTIFLSQILADNALLSKHLGKYYRRFVFIPVEGYLFSALDLEDLFFHIQLTLEEKLRSKKTEIRTPTPLVITLKNILKLLEQAVQDGKEVIFIINEIDNYEVSTLQNMFTSLEHLVSYNRQRVHTFININNKDILDLVHQSTLIQNILSIPLPPHEECVLYVDYFANQWDISLTPLQKKSLIDTCGHNLGLLKESLRIIQKQPSAPLLHEPTLLLKAKVDYQLFGKEEKLAIEEKVHTHKIGNPNKSIADALERANFWDARHVVPTIFEQVILLGASFKEFSYNSEQHALLFGDIDIQKKLSAKEYSILLHLFQNKNKLVTRESVAGILWGKESAQEYSDWAVDKIISRLRKKLEKLHSPYGIHTKKKKGFVLEA